MLVAAVLPVAHSCLEVRTDVHAAWLGRVEHVGVAAVLPPAVPLLEVSAPLQLGGVVAVLAVGPEAVSALEVLHQGNTVLTGCPVQIFNAFQYYSIPHLTDWDIELCAVPRFRRFALLASASEGVVRVAAPEVIADPVGARHRHLLLRGAASLGSRGLAQDSALHRVGARISTWQRWQTSLNL